MLRGHIEHTRDGLVSGWIYSPISSLAGQTVLAFDGSNCIGAGKIHRFREDLLMAGLGDGHAGFEINCDPGALQDATQLSVRLEGSDFILPHAGTIQRSDREHWPFQHTELEQLEWMAKNGWLTDIQLAISRGLTLHGYYIITLSREETEPQTISTILGTLLRDTISKMMRMDFMADEPIITSSPMGSLLEYASRPPVERFVAIGGQALSASVNGASSLNQKAPISQSLQTSCFQALLCFASIVDRIEPLTLGDFQIIGLHPAPLV